MTNAEPGRSPTEHVYCSGHKHDDHSNETEYDTNTARTNTGSHVERSGRTSEGASGGICVGFGSLLCGAAMLHSAKQNEPTIDTTRHVQCSFKRCRSILCRKKIELPAIGAHRIQHATFRWTDEETCLRVKPAQQRRTTSDNECYHYHPRSARRHSCQPAIFIERFKNGTGSKSTTTREFDLLTTASCATLARRSLSGR